MTEDFEVGGRPLTNRDSDPLAVDYSKLDTKTVAAALGAYALNLAYGATLQPFEVEHLVKLAKAVGCEITDKHLSFSATRKVLEELLKERRSQIEVHGYTLEYDDANPEHAHQQVLDRANQFPSSHTRKDLVELAAIAVAEIERLDRAAMKTWAEQDEALNTAALNRETALEAESISANTEEECSTDSAQQSSWTRPKAQLQHTR